MRILRHLLPLAFLFAACLPASTPSQAISVAAAADLTFALTDLVQQYQRQTGRTVNLTFGSSGNFFAQLQNGAPFDLFFSADSEYPRNLISSGLADSSTLYLYAVGRLVIWAPADSPLDVPRLGWQVLLDDRVRKIAIANPAHAPYGRAAVAALRHAGKYQSVQSRLVFGEDISQAAQFVQSANAQVGIIALSLALSPAMKNGREWQIPADSHPPIEQAAVVLKSSRNRGDAEKFLDFAKSTLGREALAKYGFVPPASAPSP